MFSEKQMTDETTILEPNKLNVNKTASVCALFAPISIVVTTIITTLSATILNSVLNRFMGFTAESVYMWSQISNGIVSVLSLGIYIGLYLIFVRRNLSKLPLVLCLLAPGSSVLVAPLTNLVSALVYYLGQMTNIAFSGAVNAFIIILFAIVRAVIAYFIVRWLFKKILSNTKE